MGAVLAARIPQPSTALAGVAALALGSSVLAQDEPEPLELTAVVVTGSRIPRPDFESASPIVTVGQEAFDSSGAPTVEATLNRLPQFAPSLGSTSNNPGLGGQAALDLRGLGRQATLVLIDGRRMVPANVVGIADVNLIPPTLIERVEIITGGASSVYGSDAVAGVVNFLLKESFEGFELGGFYGQTDRGDGAQWDLNLTAGRLFAGGRGTVYAFVGHAERKLVTAGDRAFSRYPLQYVGPGNGSLGPDSAFVAIGNRGIEDGVANLPIAGPNPIGAGAFDTLFQRYGYDPGAVPLQNFLGFNQDGTLFAQGTGAPGSVANFRGTLDPVMAGDRLVSYNFAPPNALQLPLERTSAFSRLQFDLSPAMKLYAEGIYAGYETTLQHAPTVAEDIFPRSNPFIPDDLALLLDSRPNPEADFRWLKRMSVVGPRVQRNEYDVYQGALGFNGHAFGDWKYDAYVLQGETRWRDRQFGNVLRSRMRELTFALDGGLAACGGFDIFGPTSVPEACAGYIGVDAANDTRARRFVAEASLQGPLLEMRSGELRTAFGVFHMRDRFTYTADPIASVILPDGSIDILGFNASDDIDGEERNTDLYVEALVPLPLGRAEARALDLGLGYRHARYDSAGSADAYKLELLYRPVDALRLRGSFQQAVRAPSVGELYWPQLPAIIGGVRDPCRADSAARNGPDATAVEALCLAQGIPPELLAGFQTPFDSVIGLRGGNPDLESERGQTWTAGAAWSPAHEHPQFGWLQLSLDAYRIEVKDAISGLPFGSIVELCFDPGANPDFSPERIWCTLFSRDPDTGQISEALEIPRNLARVETRGVDLQLDWRKAVGPGYLSAKLLASRLGSFRRSAGAGAPVDDLAGTIIRSPGQSYPKWKGLLGLRYAWRGASVFAQARYVDHMQRQGLPEFEVPSRTYLDLFGDFAFSGGPIDGLRLGLGIENLTDRRPPIIAGALPDNTDPQQYDILGRRYFLRLSYRR